MKTVVGIFTERAAAERAMRAIEAAGIPRDKISLVFPEDRSLAGVPTTEAEPPGIGRAIGGVVGGATGAATGLQAGALVSMFVPGVGPVLALGLLGAAVLGVAGVAIGEALDTTLREGLPKDELYVYEDALRQGRSLVVALAADETEAENVRRALAEAGAESLDAARERWWIGLREAEAAAYTAAGGEFARDETDYRCGFEAALSLGPEAGPHGEALGHLRERYPETCEREAFRRGYERARSGAEARTRSPRAA